MTDLKKKVEEGDKVYLQATFVKEFDNGNVRVSFAPQIEAREFPVFEMNIPKDAILSLLKPISDEPKDITIAKLRCELEELRSQALAGRVQRVSVSEEEIAEKISSYLKSLAAEGSILKANERLTWEKIGEFLAHAIAERIGGER